ncbi:MAG: hypothetical protein IJU46_01870 [Clostridia bacterium]|nr:hypothetical protein [Clostridia bacterium]
MSGGFKKTAGCAAVYLSAAAPVLSTAASLVFCGLDVWTLSNGDGTRRAAQSVYGILSSSAKSSAATLSNAGAEPVDIALAKWLRPLPAVVWTVFGILIFLSLWQAVFTAAAYAKAPGSRESNRIKVWFGLLFRGRFLHPALPFLAVIPQLVPYYVIDRFGEFYRVSGMDGGKPTYYEYSVSASFNTAVASLVIALLSLLLFIAAMRPARRSRLDMYTKYEPAAETRTDSPRTRRP